MKHTNVNDVTPEEQILAARVMGGIGIALIFIFFLTIAYSVYENSKTIAVQGVVTLTSFHESLSTHSSRSTYKTYGHTFQFTDKDGIERIGTDNGERQSRYPVGDIVSIGYYPDNPSRIRIYSWFGLWELQLMLLGVGLVLVWYMIVAVKQVKANVLAQKLS